MAFLREIFNMKRGME